MVVCHMLSTHSNSQECTARHLQRYGRKGTLYGVTDGARGLQAVCKSAWHMLCSPQSRPTPTGNSGQPSNTVCPMWPACNGFIEMHTAHVFMQ